MSEIIAVIGVGRLGLCFALSAAKAGITVLGADKREDYVAALKARTYRSNEPGVNELLDDNIPFDVTTDREEALVRSRISFVFVATPSLGDGSYDHSAVDEVIDELPTVGETRDLVVCCTTMPGYVASRAEQARAKGFRLSYNPEFIAQGNVVQGIVRPDMLLIGEADHEAGDVISRVYEPICPWNPPRFRMSTTAAEVTKIALNCFLTMKISFANAIGDLLYRLGCEQEIVQALACIGQDHRIGTAYLKYGDGYGGPCLPRDNRALALAANRSRLPLPISIATDEQNRIHLRQQYERLLDAQGANDPIAFSDVTYKAGTYIIEESQRLALAEMVARVSGRKVLIQDCAEVIEQVRELHGDLFTYEVTP